MRVISGQARGLKLASPEGLDTRPTLDRVKEAMFNIISPHLPADSALDLFSGSGALGIEALSRGTRRGVFVEQNASARRILEQNLGRARMTERSEVIAGDAFTYLSKTSERFDIIFLDPPYNKGLLTQAICDIAKYSCLKPDGIIVAEGEVGGEAPSGEGFEILKSAKYGKTMVYILSTGQGG